MASLTSRGRGHVVLDSGAISALADGDARARATIARARREGRLVVIPSPVLVEVHTGRRDHARIDRIIKDVDLEIPTSPEVARHAGELRSRSGVLDVVDAIVVAEAVAHAPSVILTSDPGDIQRLIDAAGFVDQVTVIAI